jgi:hypothetical protein
MHGVKLGSGYAGRIWTKLLVDGVVCLHAWTDGAAASDEHAHAARLGVFIVPSTFLARLQNDLSTVI